VTTPQDGAGDDAERLKGRAAKAVDGARRASASGRFDAVTLFWEFWEAMQ
jgi:hypothetical protein